MPQTDWTNELKPGDGWLYDQVAVTYDQILLDGSKVLYDSAGEETAWTLENK